jgi:CheY-like chemotaxis protein
VCPSEVPVERPTILVVEDDDVVRRVICRALWLAGYRTLEARRGPEALQLIESPESSVDLVITDIVMPEMEGWELGRRIGERWPEVPVLYISSYEQGDILHRGPAQPRVPFLQKPFRPNALLEKVKALLGR